MRKGKGYRVFGVLILVPKGADDSFAIGYLQAKIGEMMELAGIEEQPGDRYEFRTGAQEYERYDDYEDWAKKTPHRVDPNSGGRMFDLAVIFDPILGRGNAAMVERFRLNDMPVVLMGEESYRVEYVRLIDPDEYVTHSEALPSDPFTG